MLKTLLGDWLMDDELFPEGTQRGLTDLYIALNMGEPWEYTVEIFKDGYGGPDWRWRWTHWRERLYPHDDHQHCVFCHTNIQDDAVTEAWRAFDDDGAEQWVCAGCFEKLRGRFGWKTEPAT